MSTIDHYKLTFAIIKYFKPLSQYECIYHTKQVQFEHKFPSQIDEFLSL